MKKLISLLICILAISSFAIAADPNPVRPGPPPNQGIVPITADNSAGIGLKVSPLDDLKKLIPQGTILIDVRTDEILPYLGNSLRQLLAKNKIGTTISGDLQDNYLNLMKQRMGPPSTPDNFAGAHHQFMTQCAREIGGYLLNVQINYSGQDYTVFIEYELIDPANSTIICANSLKDHYGWWSWRRDSETAMIDNSLKRMVKDLGNQLKKKKSNLIHK